MNKRIRKKRDKGMIECFICGKQKLNYVYAHIMDKHGGLYLCKNCKITDEDEK